MKNIFDIFRKRRIENLANKLINELQKDGLELDPVCTLVNIWLHNEKDMRIDYTANEKVLENSTEFKFHKGAKQNE